MGRGLSHPVPILARENFGLSAPRVPHLVQVKLGSTSDRRMLSGPLIGADLDVVAALVVAAIDQDICGRRRSAFRRRLFLRIGHRHGRPLYFRPMHFGTIVADRTPGILWSGWVPGFATRVTQ